MRVWIKSACVVFAWGVVLAVVMAAGLAGRIRPTPASTSMATSNQVTFTAARDAAVTAAGPAAAGRAARHRARYVVQPGDTLSGIAAALGVAGGWPVVYAANRAVIGPDPGLIRPGTVLLVPGQSGPVRYTVAAGDTLSGIAAALGVAGGWPVVYAANRAVIGPDPNVIRPGTALTIPSPAPASAPSPAPSPVSSGDPRRSPPPPTQAPGPRSSVSARRATTASAAGTPQWLMVMLATAGLIIALAFLAEPVLAARRRPALAGPTSVGSVPAATPGLDPYPQLVPVPGPGRGPGTGGRIVVADYDRLVVTCSPHDGTVYVLRPRGTDPQAILRTARLVLGEARYLQLARRLGMSASWPIVLVDYPKLVVTCNPRDDTVYVLRPPGQDLRAILAAARLVLTEGPYGELADQLGVPANWPME